MQNIRKLTEDLFWIGANNRKIDKFEGVYELGSGMSYNSYFGDFGKTVLMDTADKAVAKQFFENLAFCLDGRPLDYVIVHHMEPDHSATLIDLLHHHTETQVICNAKTLQIIGQFFPDLDISSRTTIVKDGDTASIGSHEFKFLFAPMVHWPEVMFSFDMTSGILFSADAFGSYGAIDGSVFADGHDFGSELKDEARRYYTNIVGKYGMQTVAALKKAGELDIKMICPLHSYMWRKDFDKIISCYQTWGSYTPEKQGVLIIEGSIYGNTANVCEVLATELDSRGIESVIYDASVKPASEFIAAAFKYSHIVVAAPTYNMNVYSPVEHVLTELAAHGIKNRTCAVIENGSWAPQSGKIMRELLGKLPGTTVLEDGVTIKSAPDKDTYGSVIKLADAIAATFA
ncbi:MAG: FprA family A-type flavoprotein [Clostridiales bacterium]|nr:FprA family A-type flavoprotein [Clostridiales bacterium]